MFNDIFPKISAYVR